MTTVRFDSMAAWEACPDCTDGPAPGARALLAYWLESFEPLASSMGIFNCRPVRGSSSLSMHACGRAVDAGIPVTDEGRAVMYEWLRRLAPHAKRLGIQYVIFNRTHWSARRDPDGEPYRGAHPHNDHAHVELNREASARLTLATLRSVVGDHRDDDTPTPAEPAPQPSSGLDKATLVGRLPTVRFDQGTVRGDQVRTVQSLLGARGRPPARTFAADGQPDGIGGAGSRTALARFQERHRTGRADGSADLIVGPQTWGALAGTVRVMRFDRGIVRGSVVSTIQTLLAARGYPPARSFPSRGTPDGIGGAGTRDALARFQRDTGTGAADGSADLIAGPKTWAALLAV